MANRWFAVVLIMLAALLTPLDGNAAQAGSDDAVVTVIQGTARVFTRADTIGRPVQKGDLLKKEHEIRVGDKSRIEIRFPDGTVMRLAEKSVVRMNELSFNKQTEKKNVKVDLGIGKLWANVKKLTTSDSSVEVKTSNAVAGVRGTVYRVNVESDNSAMVKVYDGSVSVGSVPKDSAKASGVTPPHQVSGPHEVPPPYHEVTMEQWTAIVKAMQQITISPQGVPSKPQDFDLKSDADDWVNWNQERDKEVAF